MLAAARAAAVALHRRGAPSAVIGGSGSPTVHLVALDLTAGQGLRPARALVAPASAGPGPGARRAPGGPGPGGARISPSSSRATGGWGTARRRLAHPRPVLAPGGGRTRPQARGVRRGAQP
ncbi:hypothetical protein NKH77_33100 [Streptomyces sp. M19]